MTKYVVLAQWTSKGIENIKDSPSRLQKARDAVKAAGGAITGFYMTMGRYDMVILCEAPDDEAFAKAMLAIAAGGSVTTETLRAFDEEAYQRIVSSLP